ncbi:NRDE family protein [Aliiglaciecola sp. CAU 1673]|uniref:NRDE family protein n=1 Tax=Aliiglaciecola sp. CAU 1673 TaxID=3032595 RepID=UPI0023DC6759|nr:NRDE family protein [Aliiglaciecola sp. CAU 1673]MDF2179991.1 NRDE family protein [Aliiglaciecola sp. CAU 1673]
MCILFIAIDQHPRYALILAANRDEFFARPTAASGFWKSHPTLLAGRDLQAGGTWMGMTMDGRIAALTNIRHPASVMADRQSRGDLVADYLKNRADMPGYLATLRQHRQDFNGYNLLFGSWRNLGVYNNHLDDFQPLGPGIYGLSNADIHSPWPKTGWGVRALGQYCEKSNLNTEHLFELLRQERQAEDHQLPNTGVELDWERRLSSIFIRGQTYGTRSSTLLLVDKAGHCLWHERSFNQEAQLTREFRTEFALI